MNIVGIICEYNPFHNGHSYQLETVRKRFGTDCAVIAIMSGNFVQRGEAALLDKWSRTRAALLCGVNLVIELPAVYATGSAERFADGGVALAAACGLCDHLVFGSESGELSGLESIAEILAVEPTAYKQALRDCLDLGLSFPVSRAKALHEYDPTLQADLVLGTSNNILAIEYLKAMKRRNIREMKPYTIRREGQGYRETDWESGTGSDPDPSFWSASAIRALVAVPVASFDTVSAPFPKSAANLIGSLVDAVPVASLSILAEKFQKKECFASQEILARLYFPLLRSTPLESMACVPGMNEGVDARLKEYAKKSRNMDTALASLIDDTTTKRYPSARIRRALLHMALGLTNTDLSLFDKEKGPFYLRILGFDKKGRYLLKRMKTSATLPILMKGSDFLEYANNPENRAFRRMAELDCIATDLWMLQTGRTPGQDFTTPPVTFSKI